MMRREPEPEQALVQEEKRELFNASAMQEAAQQGDSTRLPTQKMFLDDEDDEDAVDPVGVKAALQDLDDLIDSKDQHDRERRKVKVKKSDVLLAMCRLCENHEPKFQTDLITACGTLSRTLKLSGRLRLSQSRRRSGKQCFVPTWHTQANQVVFGGGRWAYKRNRAVRNGFCNCLSVFLTGKNLDGVGLSGTMGQGFT